MKQGQYKLLWIVLLAALQFPLWNKAYAVDAAGGELRYVYVNDTTYRFYYKYYRGCSGFPEWTEVSLCYRNTTCGGVWYTKRLEKMTFTPDGRPNGQMVDVGCAGQTNTCNDPASTNEMYREWWYSGVVTVPACNKWLFSVNTVQRDVTGPSNLQIQSYPFYNLYVEAAIDNLNYPRQSSPFFTVAPPVYTCSGSPFAYNGGVTDPDGDSLVYKIIQPRSAQADLLVICAGYPPYPLNFSGSQYNLVNNPLSTNNTFALNAATGDMSFTPASNQEAYLALLVEKYRNGALIGSIMRDSRLEVKTCTTPPIQFSLNPATVSGGSWINDTLWVCSNNALNFCFAATTTTAGARLVARDNSRQVMPGAVVTYQNQATGNVTGCVAWIPEPLDTGLRYFVVSVKDSTCGSGAVSVIQSFRIPIYVRQGTAIQVADTIICPRASAVLTAEGGSQFTWSSLPNNSGFSCTQCNTTVVTPADTTQYIVTSNLNNGCSNKDTLRICIDRSNSIVADPDTIVLCNGGEYVQLSAQAFGPRPLRTITCEPYTPVSTTALRVADLGQSSNNSNSSNIHYNYQYYWGPFYQYYGTQKMQVIYRKEDMVQAGMKPGTLQRIALNFGSFTGANPTYSNVKIALRCTNKTEFLTPFQSEFETGLTEVFSAASVTLQPGWNEFVFTIPYDYDTNKNLNVQFCYNGVSPQSSSANTGMMPVYYVTTGIYKSSIATGQTMAANACSVNVGTVVTYNRRPDTRFSYVEEPEGNFVYNWTPATGMSNPGAPVTGVNVDTTTWFTVTTKGRRGCTVSDSVLVYVAEKDFKILPPDPVVCVGDVVRLTGYGGYQYSWYNDDYSLPAGFSCYVCNPTDVTAAIGYHPYKVIVTDYFGCSDTVAASVTVNPVPSTHILNNDTLINFGDQIQLFAEGAAYYIWSPPASLSNHRVPAPMASPSQSTLYIVTGYDPGGCSVSDSVWVRVKIIEEPFIPNAFSPNGDGLNDVFKVGNLTFQRIMAFSVYNRWGEEVYKAGVNQNGWDGNYKGLPAPIGTYYYWIQLAFPDGKVKNYKGDLTLIR